MILWSPSKLSTVFDKELSGVLTGGTTLATLQAANAGLAYVLQVLLARWMNVGEFGEYAFTWAWATLLAIPAGFGLPFASLRFIPEYFVGHRWSLLAGFLGWSRRIVLVAGGAIGLVGMLVLCLSPMNSKAFPFAGLILAFVTIPLLALSNLYVRQSQAFGWPVRGYYPQIVAGQIGLALLAAVTVQLEIPLTASHVMIFLLICYGIANAVQSVTVQKGLPQAVKSAKAEFDVRKWTRVSGPLLMAGAAYMVLERTDLIMIRFFIGSESVAIYNAAAKTALAASFLLTAIGSMAAPRFSALYSEGRLNDLQRLVTGVTRWMFWPNLITAGALAVFGKEILGLFGENYQAAYPYLMVLVAGQVANIFVGPAHHILNVTGNELITAWGLCIVALINIVLNAVLIPRFGAQGASMATAASLITWNAALPFLVWRRTGIFSVIVGRQADQM